MVVSTPNVLSFQTMARFFERFSPVGHGHEHGGRSRVGRQFYHDRIDRVGHGDQRMERIQEFFHQDGHVSFCVHHVRKDVDRTSNLRARVTDGRIRWVPDQDANHGRHHYGSNTPHVGPLGETVRP